MSLADLPPPSDARQEKRALGNILLALLDGKVVEAHAWTKDLRSDHVYHHPDVFRALVKVLSPDGTPSVPAFIAALNTAGPASGPPSASYAELTDAQVAVGFEPDFRAALDLLEDCRGRREMVQNAIRNLERAHSPVRLDPVAARVRSAFTVWKPSEFLNYEPPPGQDLLGDGLLRRSELCLLAGQGGLGKSRLSLWLALCQITGRPWCGLPTKGAPATWLFVGNENSVVRWKTDLRQMQKNFSADEWALIETKLRLVALVEPADGVMILSESAARLAATLAAHKPDVLVLDPWAAFIPGNENDTQDTRDALAYLFGILRQEAPTAAVLVVAHARTGRDQAKRAADCFDGGGFVRGSKVLFSTARAQLNLAPGDSDDAERLVLACGKTNNGERFETRGLLFDSETFAYGLDPDFNLTEWRAVVEGKSNTPSLTMADLWRVVESGECKTGKIADRLKQTHNASKRTVERLLSRAVDLGYLASGNPHGTYLMGATRPPGLG